MIHTVKIFKVPKVNAITQQSQNTTLWHSIFWQNHSKITVVEKFEKNKQYLPLLWNAHDLQKLAKRGVSCFYILNMSCKNDRNSYQESISSFLNSALSWGSKKKWWVLGFGLWEQALEWDCHSKYSSDTHWKCWGPFPSEMHLCSRRGEIFSKYDS